MDNLRRVANPSQIQVPLPTSRPARPRAGGLKRLPRRVGSRAVRGGAGHAFAADIGPRLQVVVPPKKPRRLPSKPTARANESDVEVENALRHLNKTKSSHLKPKKVWRQLPVARSQQFVDDLQEAADAAFSGVENMKVAHGTQRLVAGKGHSQLFPNQEGRDPASTITAPFKEVLVKPKTYHTEIPTSAEVPITIEAVPDVRPGSPRPSSPTEVALWGASLEEGPHMTSVVPHEALPRPGVLPPLRTPAQQEAHLAGDRYVAQPPPATRSPLHLHLENPDLVEWRSSIEPPLLLLAPAASTVSVAPLLAAQQHELEVAFAGGPVEPSKAAGVLRTLQIGRRSSEVDPTVRSTARPAHVRPITPIDLELRMRDLGVEHPTFAPTPTQQVRQELAPTVPAVDGEPVMVQFLPDSTLGNTHWRAEGVPVQLGVQDHPEATVGLDSTGWGVTHLLPAPKSAFPTINNMVAAELASTDHPLEPVTVASSSFLGTADNPHAPHMPRLQPDPTAKNPVAIAAPTRMRGWMPWDETSLDLALAGDGMYMEPAPVEGSETIAGMHPNRGELSAAARVASTFRAVPMQTVSRPRSPPRPPQPHHRIQNMSAHRANSSREVQTIMPTKSPLRRVKRHMAGRYRPSA